MIDVDQLLNNALSNISKEQWESCVRHAEQIQDEDSTKAISRTETMNKIRINLRNDNDSEDEDESQLNICPICKVSKNV
jgi:hypothetical protein